MRILIEITTDDKKRIDAMVAQGRYTDFSQFISVAIENLLLSESGDDPYTGGDYDVSKLGVPSGEPGAGIERPAEEDLDILGLGEHRLIWGPHKIFPVKYLCRLLHSWSPSQNEIPLKTFLEEASADACRFGGYLLEKVKLPRHEKGLSVGFPGSHSKASITKAKDRFSRQYIFAGRKNRKKSGAMVEMLFADVFHRNGKRYIALTDAGIKFARIPNPVIAQEGDDGILSRAETEFFLKHCHEHIPDEFGAMAKLSSDICDKIVSKTELNKAFGKWISTWKEPWPHLESYANRQRSGILNRMTEMGLVEKTYRGFYFSYQVTELGRELPFVL